LSGGPIFTYFEADNPKVILQGVSFWCDLGKMEIVPVMETEEATKVLPKE